MADKLAQTLAAWRAKQQAIQASNVTAAEKVRSPWDLTAPDLNPHRACRAVCFACLLPTVLCCA